MKSTDVVVIGAGASGMLAALVAKDFGADVLLIEKENRVGKKILTTGNGRCNFSNQGIKPPYDNFHSSNKQFFINVLNQLPVIDTLNLFTSYGFQFVNIGNKIYPASLQASSVVDLFRLSLEERGIETFTESQVLSIKKVKDEFLIETNNEEHKLFTCKKVLIACGGYASPQTGSDGSIHSIVKKLGHNIIKPLPSIVQLKLDYPHLKAISGVRFDTLASVYVNDKLVKTDFDEVLFTDYGISGPAILQISRYASIALDKKQKVEIKIDLYTDKSISEVEELFETQFAVFAHRSVFNALIGLIHKKLIPIILKDCNIDMHKSCDQLEYQEKVKLYQLLKAWTFSCVGTNGFKNAQTTIGGVDTTFIDEHTLESKIVKGLFFSGETLDVDGDCGGYNLQWAWSSGYVAGINLAK